MYSLNEIDLQNGLVKKPTMIGKMFPEKIKANNGHIYILYKDFTRAVDKRKLYQGDLPI